jgi:glycosyltransferase involved in cell wall biosynthesis
LILLEGIYLMRYIDVIRRYTRAKVALRPHNVEFIIWERLYQTESNWLKKQYLHLLAKRIKKFEMGHINRADILVPVSSKDLEIFRSYDSSLKGRAFPIGYSFESLPEISDREENAVGFIGGMDWIPNREGIDWFIEKVWPRVIEQIPGAKFYLAGRNFPDEIRNLKVKGLTVVGEVDDAKAFISSKAVSIVPLFAGSGMRVKIVEAMALGRAIISTTIGAESLEYADGRNILIADDAERFASAIINVLEDQKLRMSLGKSAQQLVMDKYDNRKICSELLDFCKSKMS